MHGRNATLAAAAVALIGVVAFVILDGVAAGLALFVAGVLLVAIGILGWQDAAPAVATEAAVAPESDAEDAAAVDAESWAPPRYTSGAARISDDRGDTPEHVASAARRSGSSPPQTEDAPRDLLSGSPEDDAETSPEPVSEEMPAPHPFVGGAEAVADPLGAGDTDSALDVEPRSGDEVGASSSASSEPSLLLTGAGDLDHVHDEPLRNHTDLVRHVHDYHAGVRTDGSTIQLRLLHEREHGGLVS